ncbi:MAG: hypothetical protein ABWY57_07470, partial [Mycetocola sp.]
MSITKPVSISTLGDLVPPVENHDVDGAIRALQRSSAAAATWLSDLVDDFGVPAHSEQRNSWWRMPWALALSGHRDVASALLSWAESNALDDDGDFRPGPFGADSPTTPVYHLSHLAIAAHLVDRFDLADALYSRILTYRGAQGGIRLLRDPAADGEDWLMTSQLGLLAVQFGDHAVRDETYQWFRQVWDAQPELDDLVLYTAWSGAGLVTNAEKAGLPGRVDLSKPLQMYFQPGGAAAFIAEFAAQTRSLDAVRLARDLLMLNVRGTSEQLTDQRSVHVCKFAWGAAELLSLDTAVDWTPHLVHLARWFAERQNADGSWSPSAFTLSAPATEVDNMWKTAEHLMEVEKMRVALAGRTRTPQWAASAATLPDAD